MSHDSTPRDLIDLWPSLQDFADAIGVTYNTAKAIRRRNSIPSDYWDAACTEARTRRIHGFTLQALAKAHARPVESGAHA